jgi:argininosuccinate synthase
MTRSTKDAPSEPSEIIVAFEQGVPISLNGNALGLVELIETIGKSVGDYGWGRIDMVENRRVGIKSRELYEVPGALSILLAHRALEDLTLERDLAHHKPLLEARWADLVYDGQWFSPLREARSSGAAANDRSTICRSRPMAPATPSISPTRAATSRCTASR